jgi:hypothetical protein
LNADPTVMRSLPATLDRQQSDALIERIEADFDAEGSAGGPLRSGRRVS